MAKNAIQVLKKSELSAVKKRAMAARVTVEFGPALLGSKKNYTRADLIAILKADAKLHPKSLLGQIFAHLAEHLSAEVAARNNGHTKAPIKILDIYGKCGSCNPAQGKGRDHYTDINTYHCDNC